MSIPIGETPILKGNDAVEFIKRMKEVDVGMYKCGLVPTPKLDKFLKSIKRSNGFDWCPRCQENVTTNIEEIPNKVKFIHCSKCHLQLVRENL